MRRTTRCHTFWLVHRVNPFFLLILNKQDTRYYFLDFLYCSGVKLGTGKTRTLVAAVEQIVLLTSKNVLVCAQSNTACDEITERLTAVLCEDELFRMYARTFDVCKLNPALIPYSNWTGTEFHYPSLEFLTKFRVLVCTLCTAGTLTRGGISPTHFSHIFIDECASAFETMSMIPIAGKLLILQLKSGAWKVAK